MPVTTQIGQSGMQMPLYRCHKEVWALKIKSIDSEKMPEFKRPTCRGSYVLGSACGRCERCEFERTHGPTMASIITPEDSAYAPFKVSHQFTVKHNPQAGGYFVVYKDGYQSFSPAAAFEEGYSKI